MRILLDAKNLALAQGTGIATYARNLSRANRESGNTVDILYEFYAAKGEASLLQELAFYDPQYGVGSSTLDRLVNLYHVARQLPWPRPVKATEVPLRDFVDNRALRSRLPEFDRIVTAPLAFRTAWNYFSLTGKFLPVTVDPLPDIAHWTIPYPVYIPNARNVYTVHDVIPLKLPYTTVDNRKKYLGVIRGAVAHADQIISISDTTTADLLQVAPEAAGKISNTSQTVMLPPKLLADDPEGPAVLERLLGLKHKQFFVFFAAIEPKKNVGRLIEAFLSSNSPYPLLIVGKKGWLYDEELKPLGYEQLKAQLAGEKEPASRVVMVDFVSFPLLIRLLKGARALLFPSLYEGFGLPILEAMMCGTPVMTSNSGAMAEVASQGTALWIDPLNVNEMRAAIERLAGDDELCARLSAAGLARAQDFSWDQYRENVAAAYDRALAAPSRATGSRLENRRPMQIRSEKA